MGRFAIVTEIGTRRFQPDTPARLIQEVSEPGDVRAWSRALVGPPRSDASWYRRGMEFGETRIGHFFETVPPLLKVGGDMVSDFGCFSRAHFRQGG